MLALRVHPQAGRRSSYGDDGCHSAGADVLDRLNAIGDAVGNVLESIGEGADVGLALGGEASACRGGSGNGEEELELHVDG